MNLKAFLKSYSMQLFAQASGLFARSGQLMELAQEFHGHAEDLISQNNHALTDNIMPEYTEYKRQCFKFYDLSMETKKNAEELFKQAELLSVRADTIPEDEILDEHVYPESLFFADTQHLFAPTSSPNVCCEMDDNDEDDDDEVIEQVVKRPRIN